MFPIWLWIHSVYQKIFLRWCKQNRTEYFSLGRISDWLSPALMVSALFISALYPAYHFVCFPNALPIPPSINFLCVLHVRVWISSRIAVQAAGWILHKLLLIQWASNKPSNYRKISAAEVLRRVAEMPSSALLPCMKSTRVLFYGKCLRVRKEKRYPSDPWCLDQLSALPRRWGLLL